MIYTALMPFLIIKIASGNFIRTDFNVSRMSSADMHCPTASLSCDRLVACFCINRLDQACLHKCQKEKSLCEPHESSSPHLPRSVSIGFT